MGGVGMIAVGTIGVPAIGTLQDMSFNRAVAVAAPEIHKEVAAEKTDGQFFNYQFIDKAKVASANLTEEQRKELTTIEGNKASAWQNRRPPATMCVCYFILIAYFQSKGGYSAESAPATPPKTKSLPVAYPPRWKPRDRFKTEAERCG